MYIRLSETVSWAAYKSTNNEYKETHISKIRDLRMANKIYIESILFQEQ